MVRVTAVLVALATVGPGLCGCGPKDSGLRPWPSLPPDSPVAEGPPPPHETCFRERFVIRGKEFEMRLHVLVEPAAARITRVVTERGGNGDARWTTVMAVAGDHFTSVEDGNDGPATGAGTLTGPAWSWTGWRSVTHRALGFDDHDTATVVGAELTIDTETRGPDGEVASTGQRHYLAVACATLDAEPILKLDPNLPQPKP